jgi:hypothetical protein
VKYNNFNGAYPEPVFNPAAGLTPVRYNPENGQLSEPTGQKNGRSKFILFVCVNYYVSTARCLVGDEGGVILLGYPR